MSDYGSLYLIEATFNAERGATELVFGYIAREKDVLGRNMKLRAIVNVKGGGEGVESVLEKGLKKARAVLKSASKAPFNQD